MRTTDPDPGGAPSTDPGALILDLLLMADDARASSDELTAAGAVFDQSAAAMTDAAARLVSEGRLTRTEDGSFVESGPDAVSARRLRQWRETVFRRRVWTGCWLLAADAPAAAEALQVEGFRRTAEGFWLRPDTIVGGLDACRDRLREAGVPPTLFTARLDRLDGAVTRNAASLWDVSGMGEARKALLARLARSSEQLGSLPPAAAARESLTLGAAVVRAIARDPLLPMDWDTRPLVEELAPALQAYDGPRREAWAAALTRA